jgi:hypothetical protein
MIQGGDPNSKRADAGKPWEMAVRVIQFRLSSEKHYFIKREH